MTRNYQRKAPRIRRTNTKSDLRTIGVMLTPQQRGAVAAMVEAYGVPNRTELLRFLLQRAAAVKGIAWEETPDYRKGRGGDRVSEEYKKNLPPKEEG
jgi:hypothetical protein